MRLSGKVTDIWGLSLIMPQVFSLTTLLAHESSCFTENWDLLCCRSGQVSWTCIAFLRSVGARCCPSAGCPQRALCTGSSQPRATSGALAWSSGRFSHTENSLGTSCPTVRWVQCVFVCVGGVFRAHLKHLASQVDQAAPSSPPSETAVLDFAWKH